MTDQSYGAELGGPPRLGWWRAWFLLLLPPVSLFLLTTVFAVIAVQRSGGDQSVIGDAISDSIAYILAANHILLFVLMLIFMRLDGLSFGAMGWRLRPPAFLSLFSEIVIGLIAGGVLYAVHQYLIAPGIYGLFDNLSIPSLRAASGSAPLGTDLAVAVASGIVLGGIIEEHIYRGYVLVRLSERMPASMALIPLTIGFALLHFGLGLTGMAIAGVMGLLLGILFLWRRTLPAVIVAHATVNTLVLLL